MSNHEGQYSYRITKNGEVLEARPCDDPFVVTTITDVCTRWDALKAFVRGGFTNEFTVRVTGSHAAHRVVFTTEYVEPEPVEKSDAVGFYNGSSPA